MPTCAEESAERENRRAARLEQDDGIPVDYQKRAAIEKKVLTVAETTREHTCSTIVHPCDVQCLAQMKAKLLLHQCEFSVLVVAQYASVRHRNSNTVYRSFFFSSSLRICISMNSILYDEPGRTSRYFVVESES
jgi:hypothetical protein